MKSYIPRIFAGLSVLSLLLLMFSLLLWILVSGMEHGRAYERDTAWAITLGGASIVVAVVSFIAWVLTIAGRKRIETKKE